MMRPLTFALAASLVFAAPAAAQGTLSGQGFGYPLGGLSTRALAAGGAGGEFDARSARNPAALASGFRSGIYIQYDPEFRQVDLGANRDNTVVPRFATLGVIFPIRSRFVLGASAHSLLDRTWSTKIRSGQRLGPDSVLFTETNRSSGAINESRLGLAFAPHNGKVSFGVALNLITGENRLNLRREFDDSLRYGTLARSLTLAYSGTGVSAGVLLTPVPWFSLAASARKGGNISLRVEDTLRTEASVPDRLGLAARFDAIPGVVLMASADKVSWSRLNGLGSTQANGRDAWEYALGADFTSGPRDRRLSRVVYSVGIRQRDLPFAASGAGVSERLYSGGFSAPVSGGRASLDVAVMRAVREASTAVSERAWQLSVGFTVRP